MAEIVVAQRMWQRRDTAANWVLVNPILSRGEIGFEIDDGEPIKMKVGNGTDPWMALPYFTVGNGGGAAEVVVDSSASYSVISGDAGKYRHLTSSSAKVISVSLDAAHPLPPDYEQHFDNDSAQVAVFSAESGVTIRPPTNGSLVVPPAGVVTLKRLGANSFRLIGTTVAASPPTVVSAPAPVIEDSNAAYTVLSSDLGTYRRLLHSSAKSIIVDPESVATLTDNYEQHFDNAAAGDATFVAGSGVTIQPPVGGSLVVPEGGVVTLKKVAVDAFRLIGVTVAP